MNNKNRLARRYAEAFINSFYDQLSMQQVAAAREAALFLRNNSLFSLLFKVPGVSQASLEQVLAMLCTRYGLHEYWKKLGLLLMHHSRIALFSLVLTYTHRFYFQRTSNLACAITSSHSLTDEQKEILVTHAGRLTGQKIVPTFSIDTELIVGVAITGDTLFWERSVRKNIARMRLPLIRKGLL